MAHFFIRDAQGRVLGPLGLSVLLDLINAGRLRGIIDVSPDGKAWAPVGQAREIDEAQSAAVGRARTDRDREEATRLRRQLLAMQGKQAHEIFGISRGADLDAHRSAFFRLVKRVYPDQLPPEAAPELRQAYQDTFEFFSQLMGQVERQSPPSPAKESGPPVLAGTLRPPTSLLGKAGPASPSRVIVEKRRSPPSYRLEDFVGLERVSENRLNLRLRVTAENYHLFSSDPLLNFRNGGAFVPCEEAVALGARVELVLQFLDPPREIVASGSVVSWNAGDAKQTRGFGFKFRQISDSDLSFLQDFGASQAAAKNLRPQR